jgi:hypothetical protein
MDDPSKDGFDNYVITTNDPGTLLQVTVVVLSVIVYGVVILVAKWSYPRTQKIDEDKMDNQHLLSANRKDIDRIPTFAYGTILSVPAGLNSTQKKRSSSSLGESGKLFVTGSPQTRRASFGSLSVPTRRPSRGSFHRSPGPSRSDHHQKHHPTRLRLSNLQKGTGETSETFTVHSDDDVDDDDEVDNNVLEFCDPATSIVQKLKLILCHNCDPISQSIYELSGPYLTQALIAAASEMIRLALVGHQLGTAALSAYVIVDLLVRLTSDIVGSIIYSGNTMISQVSDGSDSTAESCNAFKAGRYLQLSLILFVFGSLPFIVMWSLCMDELLIFLGYDDEMAEIGRLFAMPYTLTYLFCGLCTGLHFMLDVIGHEVESTIMTALAEIVTTSVLALFLCWKPLFPNATLVDLGFVYLVCEFLYFLTLLMVIRHYKWLDEYTDGLSFFRNRQIVISKEDDPEVLTFSNTAAISLMLTNASSLAFSMLVYHGEWQILIFFARYEKILSCFGVVNAMADFDCLTKLLITVLWDQQKLRHGVFWERYGMLLS